MPRFLYFTVILFIAIFVQKCLVQESIQLQEYSLQEIANVVKDSNILVATRPTNSTIISILHTLTEAFFNESVVKVGLLRETKSYMSEKEELLWKTTVSSGKDSDDLVFYPKEVLDRKCLLKPPKKKLKSEYYNGVRTSQAILEFLNSKCETFRTLQGGISSGGRMRNFVLQNLFRVGEDSLNEDRSNDRNGHTGPVNIGAMCERISMPTKEEFLHMHLFRL
jgi:jumonji domain-containing protein 7